MHRFLLVFLLLFGPPAAAAAAGDRASEDGVSLHLVAERPGPDGRFRAALLVGLDPGWKTYWLDPGEGGLPPRLVPRGGAEAEAIRLRLPAPHRVAEAGGGHSNVYSAPFAIAIEGRHAAGAADALAVNASLGICKTLCVPVSADLEVPFPHDDGAVAAVEAAFAALPKPSTAHEGITQARMATDNGTLLVTARSTKNAELFVSGPRGWTFGTPTLRDANDDTAVFALPVLARPRKGPAVPDAITAILSGRDGAFAADGLPVAKDGG